MFGGGASTVHSLYQLNALDRMLAFFSAQSTQRIIGETFYQGDNNPHFYFVDSGVGSDGNDGSDPRAPLATLEEAFDRVSANRGDIIWLMPGHAESLTDDLSLDVAGVTVMGLGVGASRPTFTIGDAVGEAITFDAASIRIENCIFISGVDQQTSMVHILAPDCAVVVCEFREGSSIQPLTMLNLTGASANDTDRALVIGCRFHSPTAGDGDQGIELGEVADGIIIRDCIMIGDWDLACIHNPTGKVLTNLLIQDNVLINYLTGQLGIELISACTGMIKGNAYGNDVTVQTGVDPGACYNIENYQAVAGALSGQITPATS